MSRAPRRGGRVRTGLLAGASLFLGTQANAADTLEPFISQLLSCTGGAALTVAVAGFPSDETAVSRAQADELRLLVETRLQALGRVRLATAGDVVRLKALREGTTGLPPGELEQQIKTAFAGDVSLFFVSAQRGEKSIRFRLQAITKNAGCKATSEPLDVEIKGVSAIADTDKVMAGAVDRLFQTVRDLKEVDVCPFAGAGNTHSICAAALTDRLMVALDAKSRDPSLVLRDRKPSMRRLPEGACAAAQETITAQGQFDHDRQGQSWISLEFKRNAEVIAPTGKVRISVEGLGCDPALRPFLDHVAASAPSDRNRLDIAAPGSPFSPGQRMEVRIEAKASMRLYCWVLAPDETAFVVLPVEGQEILSSVKPGTLRYPSGFRLDDIIVQEKFENLFSCFGVEGALPEVLHKQWLAYGPAANRDAILIEKPELHRMMDAIRNSGLAVEATTRLVVK